MSSNVKAIQKVNEAELRLGLDSKTSWHDEYSNSAYIFIGGLDYSLTEGDVLSVFSQYGEIVNINLVRDKKSGQAKGFCFLAYENQKSSVLAVDNLNGFKLCGRTLRVDHVRQYRRPKDGDGNEIIEKGCAPKTPTPSPTPSPQPESSLPRPKVKKKKLKDRKKKQKDKKEKRKKQKKLHVPLSSKGDGGEQEDNFDKQKSIAHDKDGSLDSGAQARHRSRSPHIGKQNWSPRDHKKQRSRSPCYREDTCTTNRSRRCNKSPVHTSRRSGGHERTSTSDRRDGN